MRRLPAALIAVLLVFPLFVAALVSIGVSTWALDRDFYIGLVEDPRLYELPDAISSASWGWIDATDLGLLFPPETASALGEILTPEYMRSQALAIIGRVFDFLDSRVSTLTLWLDLAPVKKALSSEEGARFARVLAENLPVCVAGERFTASAGRLPRCRPSNVSVDKATEIIRASLPGLAKEIPDRVMLTDSPEISWHSWGFRAGFSALRALVLADLVLLAIAAGFWVAGACVGGADARERLAWFGWSLAAPAAFVFLIGLAISIVSSSGWFRDAFRLSSLDMPFGYSEEFWAVLFDITRQALRRVATGFLAAGGIAGGIALGLLVWFWSTPKSERSSA